MWGVAQSRRGAQKESQPGLGDPQETLAEGQVGFGGQARAWVPIWALRWIEFAETKSPTTKVHEILGLDLLSMGMVLQMNEVLEVCDGTTNSL